MAASRPPSRRQERRRVVTPVKDQWNHVYSCCALLLPARVTRRHRRRCLSPRVPCPPFAPGSWLSFVLLHRLPRHWWRQTRPLCCPTSAGAVGGPQAPASGLRQRHRQPRARLLRLDTSGTPLHSTPRACRSVSHACLSSADGSMLATLATASATDLQSERRRGPGSAESGCFSTAIARAPLCLEAAARPRSTSRAPKAPRDVLEDQVVPPAESHGSGARNQVGVISEGLPLHTGGARWLARRLGARAGAPEQRRQEADGGKADLRPRSRVPHDRCAEPRERGCKGRRVRLGGVNRGEERLRGSRPDGCAFSVARGAARVAFQCRAEVHRRVCFGAAPG